MKKITEQKIVNNGVQDYLDELDAADQAAFYCEERLDYWLQMFEDGYVFDRWEALHNYELEVNPPIEAADTIELAVSC